MNQKQIEELKKKLEENRDSLQEMLEHFAKKDDTPEGDWETDYPQFESNGTDMEEEADEVEEYSSLLPVEHALETKLKNVNDALKRIEEGKYGNCEGCGEEISYEKLSISPETKHCQQCS